MSAPPLLSGSSAPERLTVTLQHSGPIELRELSASLQALASHHARFALRAGSSINDDPVRLYVREIRSGSIIVELVEMAKSIGTLVQTASSVVSFGRMLQGLLDFGKGHAPSPPPETTTADARDLISFVQPAANDPTASITIHASGNATVGPITININSTEANATQNRLRNWEANQVQPVSGIQEAMLLVFDRATADPEKATGDMARIERISPKPTKTIFADPALKSTVVTEALFRKAYIVDVDVQTVDGKPRLYKILRVIESFDRDD